MGAELDNQTNLQKIVCTKSPPPTSPPYLPPPLPSARFARQTARFARRGGQPPHPP